MLILFYRALWAVARPFSLLAGGDGKMARAIRGRAGGAKAIASWSALHRDTARPLIWFHAASVGEGRQAEAVLRRWRAAYPGWQIAFTHSSASSERLAQSLGADYAGYLPADTVGDTRRAVAALRPSLLVFAATDLWPELVSSAHLAGAKTALISATLAPTSSRRGGIARSLLQGAYRALDRVGAIGEEDADGLAALGVRRESIVITGDTRHDAAAARAAAVDRGRPELSRLLGAGLPVIVAGSTWPGDERALFDAMARLGNQRVRLVIAPHEPSDKHLTAIESLARAALPGAVIRRLSHFDASTPPQFDVVLVDKVGILADLYAAAQIAFVGGGFHDAGLHSVIEPAALGVPVLFGPKHRSSRDASLLLQAGAARVAGNGEELAAAIASWLGDEAARKKAAGAARGVVDRGIGAADRSLEMLRDLT